MVVTAKGRDSKPPHNLTWSRFSHFSLTPKTLSVKCNPTLLKALKNRFSKLKNPYAKREVIV